MSKLYTIERRTNPDHYYVFVETNADLSGDDAYAVLTEYHETLYDLLEQEKTAINVINEVASNNFTFNQFLAGMKAGSIEKNPFKHPKCKGLILVTTSSLINKSLAGITKLGFVENLRSADTVDDALKKLF
ncbi:MAG: hypothetical protein AAFV93_02180 [Chloroflexota bacterium]